MEIRTLTHAELRATKKGTIEGYAAVFNLPSDPLPEGFRETIKPGAFSRCIRTGQDVRCLFNHDQNVILGRTRSRTLKLMEDSMGLAFECRPPSTQVGQSIYASIERGDIDGCSFGFVAQSDDWSRDGKNRTLLDVDLFDVGPVTFPAYPQTSVDARSTAKQNFRQGFYHLRKSASSALYVAQREPNPELEAMRQATERRLVREQMKS